MNNRAKRRLALTLAAAFAIVALTFESPYACESCTPGSTNTQGVAANALPTYPEPAEAAASEPVKLKKFTRSQTRSARRAQSRKALLAQRARASQTASRKTEQDEEAPVRSRSAAKVTAGVANAKAEFVDTEAIKVPAALIEQAGPIAETQAEAAQAPVVELVSADEFNDLDRVAWEANQMPKLMRLTAHDSRAEMRDDDSRWAQTSTVGKMFVAFGALLTLGSAIRMFMA